MRNKSRAFTLIELLVVVLIIGILAAIAVPQYQKAVDKAHYMQAVVVVDAAAKANQRYFLANGEYSNFLGKLDVQLPTPKKISKGWYYYDWGYCYGSETDYSGVVCAVYVGGDSHRVYYRVSAKTGERECLATKDTKRANDICKSVTGKKNGSTSGDYTNYQFD